MRGKVIAASTLFLAMGTGVGVASADSATPIHFPAGGTSTTVSGHLSGGGERNYTFDARAGQTATVHFSATSSTEHWDLVDPKGNPLHNGMTEQQGDVSTRLPNSGTYRLDVQAGSAGDYTLELTIAKDSGSSGASSGASENSSGGQVSRVPTGAADTGGGGTSGIEDAGVLSAGAVALAAAGGLGAVATRRRRSGAARPDTVASR